MLDALTHLGDLPELIFYRGDAPREQPVETLQKGRILSLGRVEV